MVSLMLYGTVQPYAFDSSKYRLLPESHAELGTPGFTKEASYSKGFTVGMGLEGGPDNPWDLSVYYGPRDKQLKLTGAQASSFTQEELSSAMSTHVVGVEGGYSFLGDRIPVRAGLWVGVEREAASTGTYTGTNTEEGTFQTTVNSRFDQTDEEFSTQYARIPAGFKLETGGNITDLVAGGSSRVDVEFLWEFSGQFAYGHNDQAAGAGGDYTIKDAVYPDRVDAATINTEGFQWYTGPRLRISAALFGRGGAAATPAPEVPPAAPEPVPPAPPAPAAP